MITKALISCEVAAQLIFAFVFAYAKVRFSHGPTQLFVLRDRTKTVSLIDGNPEEEISCVFDDI